MNEKLHHEDDETILISYRELIHNFFREVKHFWWLILIATVGMAVGMFLYARITYVPLYECKASFTVVTNDIKEGDYMYNYNQYSSSQMSTTFPYILESDLLMNRIKDDLGVEQVNGTITANAVNNSNLFTITVTSDNKKDAKAIIDSVFDNYSDIAEYVIGDTKLNLLEEPEIPGDPFNTPNLAGNMGRGALFGMAIAMCVIFIYALCKRTIKKETEIRNILNVACLGMIPEVFFKKRNLRADESLSIYNDKTGSYFQESVRGIALRLAKQMQEKNEKVVMVTSTVPEEGVTSVAQNLSYALEETGNKVILIQREINEDETVQPQYFLEQWHEADVNYLFRRQDNHNSIYKSGRTLKQLIESLKEEMDFIIIDSPSCTEMSEAAIAAEYSDTVVYVVKQDEVIVRKIKEGMEDICSYNASFAGCILNQAEPDRSEYGYGKYGYGKYGYGRYGYGK